MSKRYSIGCHSFEYKPTHRLCYRTLDFLGLPGYKVGTNGSVWTRWQRKGLGRYGSTYVMNTKWTRIELSIGNDGYPRIWPHTTGHFKGKEALVHRLVLFAFIGPCPEGMECCHWDGNPGNSELSNLRWDTRASNQRDAIRHGTHRAHIGTKNTSAKLTDDQVREMRRLFASGNWTTSALGRKYHIRQCTAWAVVHGQTWKHLLNT